MLATELSHDQQHYVAHNKFYEQVGVGIVLFLRVKMKERDQGSVREREHGIFNWEGSIINIILS